MEKSKLVRNILKGMEYKEDIRNGIWVNNNPEYQEFFHQCHNGILPDDYRYEMIHDLLSSILDTDDIDDIDLDGLVPVYTNHLLNWLSSSNSRYTYCDEFKDEYGISDDRSTIDLISGGYMMELQEVYYLIMEWLDENTDEG